jgi:hypothetical protein
VSRDDDDRPRERLSWREIDRRRGGARQRPEDRPKSRDEIARDSAAAKAYTKKLDNLFVSAKGGAAGERLTREMREARGTPALAGACRAYRDAVGIPEDPSLLSLFLDSGDPELVLAALVGLQAARGRRNAPADERAADAAAPARPGRQRRRRRGGRGSARVPLTPLDAFA